MEYYLLILQIVHGDLTLYVIASNEAEREEWISLLRQCKTVVQCHSHSNANVETVRIKVHPGVMKTAVGLVPIIAYASRKANS